MVEEGNEANVPPRILRHRLDERHVVPVENPAQILERDEQREDRDATEKSHAPRSISDVGGGLWVVGAVFSWMYVVFLGWVFLG